MDHPSETALIPFHAITKYGYKNGKNEIVIQPRYNEAFGFHDGIAIIRLGCYWGYIDASGKETFPSKNIPVDAEERIPEELFTEFEPYDENDTRTGKFWRYIRKGATIDAHGTLYRYGDVISTDIISQVGVIHKHWDGAYVKAYFNSGRTVIIDYREKKICDYATINKAGDKSIALKSFVATEEASQQTLIRWFEHVLKSASPGTTSFSLNEAMPALQRLLNLERDRYEHACRMNTHYTYALSEPSGVSKAEHAVKISVVGYLPFKNDKQYVINYELESAAFPGLAAVQLRYRMSDGKSNYDVPTAFFTIYCPGEAYRELAGEVWERWQKTR